MDRRIVALIVLFAGLCAGSRAFALVRDPNDVLLRVVDCGQALCCVAQLPGDRYVIYDAGDYPSRGKQTFAKIEELVPAEAEIELLVLSHTDSDHLGAVGRICEAYAVKRVLRSGRMRTTGTWERADAAVRAEAMAGGVDINLAVCEFPMGATYRFGDVFVTMVCGFSEPPAEWGELSTAEAHNAGSIVVRIEYRGRRILLCGDAVGRHDGDPVEACLATERFMVDNSGVIGVDCDVLVAPHHGADNASSAAFIAAASPEWVIFSAGHRTGYQHPRREAAMRYLAAGVTLEKMFRTDLGDDDGLKEWEHGRIAGHHDPKGDDDVDVVIRSTGAVEVAYRFN